jgi:hypothetical protein
MSFNHATVQCVRRDNMRKDLPLGGKIMPSGGVERGHRRVIFAMIACLGARGTLRWAQTMWKSTQPCFAHMGTLHPWSTAGISSNVATYCSLTHIFKGNLNFRGRIVRYAGPLRRGWRPQPWLRVILARGAMGKRAGLKGLP